MKNHSIKIVCLILLTPCLLLAQTDKTAQAEHGMIGAGEDTNNTSHTQAPGAQWYPDAAFGLFIHWGISSVKAMNISWPMIPGRALASKHIEDPAERQRIIEQGDWNLDGKPNAITPNQYWEMAKDFNPTDYHPDKWMKAAKEAGFTYAVLTTRHHEGFSMWPSKFDDFNTSTYLNGRDLIKEYVDACHANGIKVGLYYSPPDWHFDRDYMNFLYSGGAKKNPALPALDADLKPRTTKHTPEEIAKHQEEFVKLVNGQIEELLTRYGQIDLIWFDGKPNVSGDAMKNIITQDRIRELQPGILINPRLHGHGDFITYERKLGTNQIAKGWAELCDPWTGIWSDSPNAFRSDGYELGQLATCRSLGINFLLGIGPQASGDMRQGVYDNMAVVAGWMKQNGESVHGPKPLPEAEHASVPATAAGQVRYLFALPKFKNNGMSDDDMLAAKDETLTLKGAAKPASVKLLADGSDLQFTYADGTTTVQLPAGKRTKLVDVVKVELQ